MVALLALAILGLALPISARAAMTLSLEPDTVRVAEPTTLTITSDTPGVIWPDWAESLPGWDVVPLKVNGRAATLSLRSFLPGDLAVPAVTATTPGGVTFTTEPRTVTVTSVLPEEADVADVGSLRDAAELMPGADAGGWYGLWWTIALSVGGGGVIAAVIVQRRHARPDSPEAAAAAQIDAAERSGDIGAAVDAVRTYIETRFGHRLRHQTSAELAADTAAGEALGARLRDGLSELQRLGEQARFAAERDGSGPQVIADSRRVLGRAQAVAKERPVEVKR